MQKNKYYWNLVSICDDCGSTNETHPFSMEKNYPKKYLCPKCLDEAEEAKETMDKLLPDPSNH